jgi:hypothetical protein
MITKLQLVLLAWGASTSYRSSLLLLWFMSLHKSRWCPIIVASDLGLKLLLLLLEHLVACSWDHDSPICKHLPHQELVGIDISDYSSSLSSCIRGWSLLSIMALRGGSESVTRRIGNHVIIEEIALDETVWRSWSLEILIIYFATFCWVYSHKIILSHLLL